MEMAAPVGIARPCNRGSRDKARLLKCFLRKNTRKSRCERILAPHHVGANPSGTHHSKLHFCLLEKG
jgi:hypothetical protein